MVLLGIDYLEFDQIGLCCSLDKWVLLIIVLMR